MLSMKERGEVLSIIRAMTRLNHEQQVLLKKILDESNTTPVNELMNLVLRG